MLITIILGFLFVGGIVGAILVDLYVYNGCDNEEILGLCIGGFVVFGIAFAICGTVSLCVNVCPEAKIIEWETHVEYLQNEKEVLENVKPVINSDGEVTGLTSDVYLHFDNPAEYYNAINEHNKAVEKFIVDIKQGANFRKNIWIGWFWSSAYEMFDQSKLDNLTYSKGK